MRRALILILAVALFGILAAVVVAQVGQDTPSLSGATTDSATTEDRTTTTEDRVEDVTTAVIARRPA